MDIFHDRSPSTIRTLKKYGVKIQKIGIKVKSNWHKPAWRELFGYEPVSSVLSVFRERHCHLSVLTAFHIRFFPIPQKFREQDQNVKEKTYGSHVSIRGPCKQLPIALG